MAGASLPYRFSGNMLAQAAGKNNPQKKNMGMIEFHDNSLIKGLGELSLSVKSIQIPARAVDSAQIRFLNGSVNYPSLVTPLGDMTVVFLDYVDTPFRAILEQWFSLVYNEETGLMTPPTLLKTDAIFNLFGSDGLGLRGYRLEGIFPKGGPPRESDFTSGDQLEMSIAFAIDRAIPLIGKWPSRGSSSTPAV